MSDEIKNPNTEDEEYQPDLMTLEDEDGNEVTHWTTRACIIWLWWNTPKMKRTQRMPSW